MLEAYVLVLKASNTYRQLCISSICHGSQAGLDMQLMQPSSQMFLLAVSADRIYVVHSKTLASIPEAGAAMLLLHFACYVRRW